MLPLRLHPPRLRGKIDLITREVCLEGPTIAPVGRHARTFAGAALRASIRMIACSTPALAKLGQRQTGPETGVPTLTQPSAAS